MTKRRSLTGKDRLRIFAAHGGRCMFCGGKIEAKREAWEVSHDIPLEMGGADDDVNRKPAHKKCHRTHTYTVDAPAIAKAKRREIKDMGAKSARGFRRPADTTFNWRTMRYERPPHRNPNQ